MDETLQDGKSKKDMYAWTRHPGAVITIALTVLAQFVQVTWFAAALSTRVDRLEMATHAMEMRYQDEVIPRRDLSDRLARLEKAVDRSTELIIEHDAHSARRK